MNADALILCGGQGTRFRKVSNVMPKALAKISQKPILELLLSKLNKQGFKKVVLATGYLSCKIEEYTKKHWPKMCVISKEENPLGTGGAIKNSLKYFNKENVIIFNGDTIININYIKFLKFHNSNHSDVSILLSSITKGQDYGNIKINKKNKIIKYNEKYVSSDNNLTNSGVYCFKREIIEEIPKNKFLSLERDVLPNWLKHKDIKGMVVPVPFFDIGTPERYNNANSNYKNE